MSTRGDIEVACKVKMVTERAVLIDHGGKSDCWIPLSQVSDFCGDGEIVDYTTTSLFMPEWLATEKGIL